ncbi:alpha-1,3-galactosidase A [Paenibacillus marchantiophytorum]|uniref:Alpha-1,3-galactosidase A n=1 Tax=Paenibacillus marchantiophytorum TaxID=1619310 RepID=A0ABQ1F7A4_9BACL|nr:right-handed parallel beta-helix repeat-containing protein [Paenibacillus marchantiophytorum]GGA01288.1 alpha-1,3-galactosidase A [Paenibacillus marchantiophytorum]
MSHTINVTDYGAIPDSGQDSSMSIRLAIQAASRLNGPVILNFPKGQYDLYPDLAVRVPYHISNTASEVEVSTITKVIGLYFDRHQHLTIEGNGSLLLYHGKQTLIAFEACEHVTIQNIRMDVADPSMVEMTVIGVGERYIDVQVHPDSNYEIDQERVVWVGAGWRFHHGYMQEYDLELNTTWRVANLCEHAIKVEKLDEHRLRLYYADKPTVPVGRTLQLRDGIRDQVGVFIHRSRHMKWVNVSIHYMHGLGIVGQSSEHLTFDSIHICPRSETKRTAAAFADLMHFSGCRGLIKIENSKLSAAHDDAINIHGTHLRIVGVPAPNQVVVRFMHHQTYGIDAFYAGDHIHFVREQTLAVFGSNVVKTGQRVSSRELLLTLEHDEEMQWQSGDVIENVSWNPEVEIRNNEFTRLPTRGILVTSSSRVTIEDNIFIRTGMSGILVANDASSWFESGRVQELSIRRNRFIGCGGLEHPVIYIIPENKSMEIEQPVHRHILIEDNDFEITDSLVLYAKSTTDLVFQNNKITPFDEMLVRNVLYLDGGMEIADSHVAKERLMYLTGCSRVGIQKNIIQEGIPSQVVINQMSYPDISVDEAQQLHIRRI